MIREAIQQELIRAGWEVDDGFSGHLLIGNAGDLSILTPWGDRWSAAAPHQYELYDVQSNVACRVGVIPTPLRARMLLEEHGESAFVAAEQWATTSTN